MKDEITFEQVVQWVEELQCQNSIDFQGIKNIKESIKKLNSEITKAKNLNNSINKKILSEYEKIKKIILDENVSVTLDNKISNVNKLLNDLKSNVYSLENGQAFEKKTNENIKTISSQLDNKASKDDMARISSGTPLFATNVAEMTDTTRNYVNTTDGYLYIYSGSAWVKSSVLYQSSGINNNSVSHRKLEDELKALFVPYYSKELTPIWIDGLSIKYDGTTVESSAYKYCKYPVKCGEVYKIKTQRLWANCGWIVMDSSNKVILTDSQVDSTVFFEQEIEIPINGCYLCFNNWKGDSFGYLAKTKYKLKESKIKFDFLPDELKNSFEYTYDDITSNINWIAGKYIKSDGTFVDSTEHSYVELDVYEGMEYKITGSHSWGIACYVVKDPVGTVMLQDGASNSVVTDFNAHTFTIPRGGVKLYINKYSFKELQLKNKLSIITGIKSPLENKTLLFTGDSICVGAIEISPGVYNGQYGWAEIIKENNPTAIVKNYGVGGSTIATNPNSSKDIIKRLDKMYSEYPSADYIIFEGGVNDCYSTSIQLGDISNGYNATLDESTFCGALESLFKKSILKWKGKKIGYIVTFKVPTADPANFGEYMSKAKLICEKWSIPYIDLYNGSGLEYHIEEIKKLYSYGGGGLHPNIDGYKIITPKIENWIKSL